MIPPMLLFATEMLTAQILLIFRKRLNDFEAAILGYAFYGHMTAASHNYKGVTKATAMLKNV